MNPTGSFTTLDDWLPWLETLSPREIVLGLERVQEVLNRLDLARPSLVINVAGTNGKGSCAAMLEALLRAGGCRTGCYTSPHLSRYNERIRINGESASDEQILAGLERVEKSRGDVPLTFFEFGTLAALAVFDTATVDTQVLEVGMGGRLDAVNAINPDACLITNVSLDHCAWLGDDVESIGAEKAGVMRTDTPVVFGSAEIPQSVNRHAAAIGAELLVAGIDFNHMIIDEEHWSWRGVNVQLTGLSRPGLSGDMQLQNAAAVLALLEALGRTTDLTKETVNRVLPTLRLPGRLQVLEGQPKWLLDVAHNAASACIVAAEIERMAPGHAAFGVVGMLKDKDVSAWLSPFQDLVEMWVAVSVGGDRAMPASHLARIVANQSGVPCLVAKNLDEALMFAELHTRDGDLAVVTGSFYLVGPALAALNSSSSI